MEKTIILETERLLLRRYTAEDLEDLYEYLSEDEVVQYEPYKAMTKKEVEDNLNWRIGTDEMMAVELKDNHKMIGNVYLGTVIGSDGNIDYHHAPELCQGTSGNGGNTHQREYRVQYRAKKH